MDDKTLNILEFDKIRQMLHDEATNEFSRRMADELCPSCAFSAVQTLYKELSAAMSLLLERATPKIGGMQNISGAVRRMQSGGILNMVELINIAQVLRISRNLISYYYGDKSGKTDVLEQYFCQLVSNRPLEQEITDSILSEDEVADNASPALANIRRQIANTHESVRSHLNSLISSAKYQKYLQDAIVTIRDGRYVVPVKSEHKGDVGGIVHDMSSTGATFFIEPTAVVEANNKLRQLQVEEQAEIQRILAALTAKASEISHELYVDMQTIAKLDFIFAKAKLALKMNAVIPTLNDRGRINIIKGRHPLISPDAVVPITVSLGTDFKTLVITGPNTGGKTVTLKTIGLFSLMAMSGLAVPANDNTELCVFDNVFADIGDEQSIEQSLSTFSSHMTNIVHILNAVTPNSLVLFDELGAGTDPTEGAALAIAILRYCKEMGALSAATTHYSEIKMYALTTDGVENASCEFDVNSLRPTYRLLVGVPGKSNAFAISKRLGLPDFIIQNATNYLSEENIRFEDIIDSLEKTRREAENERQTMERYRRETERLKEEVEREKQKVALTKQKLTASAQAEARRILEQAKEDADSIISEIRQAAKEQEKRALAEALTGAKQKLNQKLREADAKQLKPKIKNFDIPKNLKPGNTVQILDIDQVGTVLSKPKPDGTVSLQVGILKINSNIENLRLMDEQKKNTPISKSKGGTLKLSGMKPELDLRGNNLEDALFMTEKFLDDAYLGGLKQVSIIHGKGTGILRKGIQDMLKHNPHVKSYRLGTFGEGETGVTICELK